MNDRTMEKTFDIFDILVGTKGDSDYARKPVVVQGITGSYGSTHTRLMKAYGTNVAAGVTPGKGGQDFIRSPNSAEGVRNGELCLLYPR